VRLPAVSADLAAGDMGLAEAISLYHMLLEGVVFYAGQLALIDELADGALPGVREGLEHVVQDERWHIGFGLRCLVETKPSKELLEDLLVRADEAAEAWGDAVPAVIRERSAQNVLHRLHVVRLLETPAAA
jgi:ribonucleoside-diphosphate reductase beta chain